MSKDTDGPAVRASSAREMLGFVDDLHPGTRDRVRALIPPASLEAIDGAAASSWIPAEHHHFMVDATLEVLGLERAIGSWRAGMSRILQRPLHKFFVEAALRHFFHQPGEVIQLIPRGWPLDYRNFCEVSFHRLAVDEAEVRFTGVVPVAFASTGYLHSWHAICQGIFDLEKPRSGRTRLTFDRAAATAAVHFRWLPPETKS